jgi:glutamate-1-semialdehyde 2,1-aminomutase
MSVKHNALRLRAEAVIPGGVNSPVRAFNAVGGMPIYVAAGQGSRITLADGRECIDCCCSWGAMILGHGDPEVAEAVHCAAMRGTTFGISTPGEVELAERLVDAIPSIEKVRLVNSGTEAVMTAIRLARGVTGRDLILKCEGCYHGHSDAMLVAAGSGVMTAGDGAQVASAGIPASVAREMLVVPYNDLAAAQRAFEAHAGKIAAVIIEPVAGNMGCVPPAPGYLAGLETLAHEDGALLICDEVINAFRFHYGLYSDLIGLHPDIVTMGKVMGGGFPLAAVGGRAEIMNHLAPEGAVYQAGTLSGNPVAVAAANVVLARLEKESPYAQMEKLTQRVVTGINEAATVAGVPMIVQSFKTVFTPFATSIAPQNLAEAKTCDTELYARFFQGMLARGVYLEPSQFEVNFISAAHTAKDVDKIVEAAKETFASL